MHFMVQLPQSPVFPLPWPSSPCRPSRVHRGTRPPTSVCHPGAFGCCGGTSSHARDRQERTIRSVGLEWDPAQYGVSPSDCVGARRFPLDDELWLNLVENPRNLGGIPVVSPAADADAVH